MKNSIGVIIISYIFCALNTKNVEFVIFFSLCSLIKTVDESLEMTLKILTSSVVVVLLHFANKLRIWEVISEPPASI